MDDRARTVDTVCLFLFLEIVYSIDYFSRFFLLMYFIKAIILFIGLFYVYYFQKEIEKQIK